MTPRILLVLLLALMAGAKAEFLPPGETKALFQRDLLPIDPDTMRSLSAQLTELAARPSSEAPNQLRATAQLLALASRLDPANPRVRSLVLQLVRKEPATPADQRALLRAKSEVWNLIDWLRQDDAGPEGQLLGAQLLDALHVIDPNHPAANQHDGTREEERWQGIVAPLAKFAAAASPEPDPENTPTDPAPVPEPSPSDPPAASVQLRKGLLSAPLSVYGANYRQATKLVPIEMDIHDNEEAGELTFNLSPGFDSPTMGKAQDRVRTALLTLWPALPEHQFAVLSTNKERYASRNGSAITGPAALLLHSALSAKPLRPDLVMLGEIQADATLTKPKYSWDYLAALRSGPGGRLLVTPDLQDELVGLIILEDPAFFLKYEVLVVSSLSTALSLGSPGSDPPTLATASALFTEIQKAADNRDVGQMVTLDSVRSRLESIRSEVPYHLSASMLLLQGSGTKRPTRLPKPLLIHELVRALDPGSWIFRADPESLNSDQVLASWQACRERLDAVEKYVEVADRPLHQQARDLVDDLRTLSRELKNGGDSDEYPSGGARKLLDQARRKHAQLQELATSTEDSPAAKGPDRPENP